MRGRENKFLFLFVSFLEHLAFQVEEKKSNKTLVLCVEGEMKKIIYMH